MNTLGTYTLCKREVWRYMKVWNQTLLSPVITALLFLAILTLSLSGGDTAHRDIEGIRFDQFIAPGLIMMAVVQNAFANTSSSIMLAKIQGVIIDILTPPLTSGEVTLALVAGGVIRGLMVGVTVSIGIYLFVPFTLAHPFIAVLYVLLASTMLALLGVLSGVWAQGFDQLSSVTNYLITPLAFLSGTFYSVRHLPEFWYAACHFNPFFYMIDGFRYAMLGYSDSSVGLGVAVLAGTNAVLWAVIQLMMTRGWRLKS